MTKIGYQGDIGSNSEAAAQLYFSSADQTTPHDYIPLLSSEGVFQALKAGTIEVGVAAIKNSLAGEVQETKKALEHYNFECKDTITIPIHHCLFTKGQKIEECQVVMSHPQALKQTKQTREKNYPWLSEREIGDQAKAAKDLSEGLYPDNHAVVCRKNAGENVGLTLIAENIEDDSSNETTFGIFVKK
uniref:Monofunctional prephenate dehydratase n=1 Tax=Piromyces sp. TaxID=45796 RepID=A0A2S1TYW1_PIRSP|nr:Monofunctional prephenate dehydratase [Piromyces sp.]